MGVDEIHIGKKQKFLTVVCNLETGEPQWLGRVTELLLNALTAMGLLVKQLDIFRNTPLARRYFTGASPDNARPALLHTAHLWQRWTHLTGCVTTGTAVEHEEIADRGEEWTEAFIAAKHPWRAPSVVRAVGADGVRWMLGVGGGSGRYSIAFAKANPVLTADILDLAPVVPIAQRHIREGGDRVHTRVGDLRSDELGNGYDLVFLSAICHTLSEEENCDLLARWRAALPTAAEL